MKGETKSPAAGRAGADHPPKAKNPLLGAALLLTLILSLLFWRSFDSAYVHFSNDGPLGAMMAEQNLMPSILTGMWMDLNWLGSEGLSPSPAITTFMRLLVSPLTYGRILPPVALLIVGVSACFCFRKFKLAPLACILGALAASLNSDFFSTCTWGVASQIVGFGANYIALGLLADKNASRQWIRVILAGMAVGIGIMEAYDIGAIFSLFVAAFIFYDGMILDKGSAPAKAGRGILRIVVVAGFAAYISAHALTTLIGTQLKGAVVAEQGMQTKQQRWYYATQWSLPKVEALQVIIPGLFGYRMDSPHGDNYWGTIGSNPLLTDAEKLLKDPDEQVRAQAKNMFGDIVNWRISGTGYYAGVPVVLVALWAALQSFRRQGSPFSTARRRVIWFWSAVAFISIPLAFGRYAPFYQFFYALPYGSVIRNPTKFMHVFSWVLTILFAYGVHGIVEICSQSPAAMSASGWRARLKNWRSETAPFDRAFLAGGGLAIVASLFGWWIYGSTSVQTRLLKFMESVAIDPLIAVPDAKFSLHAVGWFILSLTLTVVLLAAIFSRRFTGARARWGAWLLGALVVADLGHADAPWINYWNIAYKYASNPIVDLLRSRPYEYRVDILPFGSMSDQLKIFRQVYAIEWTQQLFTYYNIQSLQVIMEPRVSVDKFKFLQALPWSDPANIVRTWELTNTRWLIGNGGNDFLNALNQKFDPVQRRFRQATLPNNEPANFNLALKPNTKGSVYSDYTIVLNPAGELGVIEFTGALPRAKLFSNWQVNTNDDDTLKLLANPSFDPHAIVLVAATNFPASAPADAARDPGTVNINPNYLSKRVELSADVKVPSVLLLSERFNPKWQVEVDGQPAPLLRCDYIMRGVYLTPGHHDIVMRFVSPVATLYVSLSAIFIAVVLMAWLALEKPPSQK